MKTKQPERRTPEDLKGKTVSFFVLATKGRKAAYGGFRMGKVVKVDNGPRKGWRGVTVLTANNTRLNIDVKELTLTNQPTGIFWFGKIRHLNEWLPNWKSFVQPTQGTRT